MWKKNTTFNPIDRVKLFEENKKLYERLLQSESEKIEILKRALATRVGDTA
jgi:hypothetical protein